MQVKMGKLTLAQAACKRARASVSASRAALDKARIQEGFTELKAAFDGVVTRRTIDAGNFVQPSDSRLLRPLLTVQRIDRVRLTTRLPDNYASLIQLGLSVEVPLASGRQYTISRFSPTIAEGGGIPVEIDAANPDNRFLPGMSLVVQVQLKKPSPDALVVPSQSVMARGGYKYVFIIRDGKAHTAPITVSIDDGTNAEIAKGIQATDLIAVSNQGKLSEGQPVKIDLVKD